MKQVLFFLLVSFLTFPVLESQAQQQQASHPQTHYQELTK